MQALSAIQSVGLAAALFAPGWTYEHLGVEKFWENDKKFWVGDESLPGGPMKREEPASVTYGPISQYARLLGSGDSHFFYTNFSRGFGKGWRIDGRVCTSETCIYFLVLTCPPQLKSSKPWVHLGAQSVLPTYYNRNRQSIKWSLDDRYAYCGSWSLAISTTPTDGNMHGRIRMSLKLFPLY